MDLIDGMMACLTTSGLADVPKNRDLGEVLFDLGKELPTSFSALEAELKELPLLLLLEREIVAQKLSSVLLATDP